MAIKKSSRHGQHRRPNRFRPLPQMKAQRYAAPTAPCQECTGTGMADGDDSSRECLACDGTGAQR